MNELTNLIGLAGYSIIFAKNKAMDRNKLSRIYLIVLMIAIFVVYTYRKNQPHEMVVRGTTMGGTIGYTVKYLDKQQRNLKPQIDSLLADFNQALSTYVPDSEISLFNQTGKHSFKQPYFYEVLEASRVVYEKTNGAFDPTVGPLINAWGFGEGGFMGPDSAQVDSLLQFVGFDKLSFDSSEVRTSQTGLKLNFSAIAKGQAIDVVVNWLLSQGLENCMVEIGGEVHARGQNLDGDAWVIGIEVPDEQRIGGIFDAVRLENAGLATSGNYRNFRVLEDGRKVAHTINPKTGFPQMQTLLSATVVAPNCMLADGYATACMVLGKDKSIELIEADPNLECYLIFADENGHIDTYISGGLRGKTVKTEKSE
ncbi:FAD:protein FMN transferase [Roseivirga sp. UBA1976]|uniref:FAD:protein FMN transferase n=2 Tax=Roseivirga TaxID=290180 RepID=UPI00257F4E71|nr:FAD:protein FMN transferase [Roseivirga sp. UBA1976]|tara:strand:- start:7155 stop:8258 length:1104 start_codon:yes stop_codon:yes gene_type:complete